MPLEGLVYPGSAQFHRPGALESVRTYINERAFQEEGAVHAKYLEVGVFMKRTRSVRCVLGLYSVEDEHGVGGSGGTLPVVSFHCGGSSCCGAAAAGAQAP